AAPECAASSGPSDKTPNSLAFDLDPGKGADAYRHASRKHCAWLASPCVVALMLGSFAMGACVRGGSLKSTIVYVSTPTAPLAPAAAPLACARSVGAPVLRRGANETACCDSTPSSARAPVWILGDHNGLGNRIWQLVTVVAYVMRTHAQVQVYWHAGGRPSRTETHKRRYALLLKARGIEIITDLRPHASGSQSRTLKISPSARRWPPAVPYSLPSK
ncbi:hypothetical protein T492DRAFT_923146, partial [Pavlovales sp. CCMP2436]